jgi:hypothetical protein
MTAHSGDAWKGARFLGGWRQSDGGLSLCPCNPVGMKSKANRIAVAPGGSSKALHLIR